MSGGVMMCGAVAQHVQRHSRAASWHARSRPAPHSPTGVLLPEELNWLLGQRHKPLALGQALSTIVDAADINPMVRHQLVRVLSLRRGAGFAGVCCADAVRLQEPAGPCPVTTHLAVCWLLTACLLPCRAVPCRPTGRHADDVHI